jgi:hypothetical protein
MGFLQRMLEVAKIAVRGMHILVLGDVVPIILERRGIERKQPDRRHSEILQIIELLGQPGEITNAVAVAVIESPDV